MLVAIGVSHKTASIDIRERLAFSPEKMSTALANLISHTALEEAVLLSTCNRTEIYGGLSQKNFDIKELIAWWQTFQPAATAQLIEPVYYQLSDEKVVTHLMRLASGLDSLALGETQILGQLKQAYQQSKQVGVLGQMLGQTFEASFSVAKKIRTSTEITKHPISIAYLSILLAKRIFTDIAKTRILLLGAGENIKQIIAHLKAHHVQHVTIVNRTYENAVLLAQQCQLQAAPIENLILEISKADIIISSTYSAEPLIHLETVKHAFKRQKHRPVLMIDLGVPRDIHPNVLKHEDVYLYSVDDLHAIADENKASRKKAAIEAEKIIAYEACAFLAKLHAKQHMQSISVLRDKAENLKLKAISIAHQEINNGQSPHAVIEKLAYSLTNQLIHEPTIRMREALFNQDELMVSIYKQMFGIE